MVCVGVRQIDGVLDLAWVHQELAPYYSHTGRPSIDPVLMIRMLIVGYVFAIRSERRLCAEVQVNLAYRWFCKLGVEDKIPTFKRDYARLSILPDAETVIALLPAWFEDYNEVHPHSGLKFLSPREFLRLSA